MSQTTASTDSTGFQPHTGDHEDELEYAQSIRDFSVPQPVADHTGITELSAYNGMEHRGHTFVTSGTITDIRRALHHEHCHAGTDSDPQSGITQHAAIDRTVSALTDRFDNWFETTPDGYDRPTSDEAVDPETLYKRLMADDLLNWREQGRVPYAREAHRQIIVAALALLLQAIAPQQQADADAEREAATERLQYELAMRFSTTLSREDVLEVVNDVYDEADAVR